MKSIYIISDYYRNAKRFADELRDQGVMESLLRIIATSNWGMIHGTMNRPVIVVEPFKHSPDRIEFLRYCRTHNHAVIYADRFDLKNYPGLLKKPVRFKPIDEKQSLVNLCFSLVLTALDQKDYFDGLDTSQKAEWVANQLRECGFPTLPAGSSWGVLTYPSKNTKEGIVIVSANRPGDS